MTEGSSQGLFVIVAIVIFGIFVLISYVLFRESLKSGLSDIFDTSLEQNEHSKNLVSNIGFKDLEERDNIGWDEHLNGNLVSKKTSDLSYWSIGFNNGETLEHVNKGFHAHINTSVFSEPVVSLNNTSHLVDSNIRPNRWLGINHLWKKETEFIQGLKTAKFIEIKYSQNSNRVNGAVTLDIFKLSKELYPLAYEKDYSKVSLAKKKDVWENVTFKIPVTEEIRNSEGMRMYFTGYLNDNYSIKYIKDIHVGLIK